MTDIARHLNTIIQTLHHHFEELSDAPPTNDLAAIRAQLAQILPDSYGVGSGIIRDDQGHTSQPIQCLIYDKPLAANSYTNEDTCFHIQHVLLIIDATTHY